MYDNTGLRTRRARSQFRARELPVSARVYADRVRQPERDYVLCVNIFLVLYYLIMSVIVFLLSYIFLL